MCGWLWPLLMTMNAFFIGRGKTRILMQISLVTTLLNAGLDYILIFGQPAWHLPAMGAPGAAMATVISMAVQILTLLYLFLRRSNRVRYQTGRPHFNAAVFWGCIRTGWPISLSIFCEICGWSVVSAVVAYQTDTYMAVYTVIHTFCVVLLFIPDGLKRAIQGMSAFLIGRNKVVMHYKMLRSCAWIVAVIGLLLIAFVSCCGDWLVNLFLNSSGHSWDNIALIRAAAKTNIWWCVAYFMLDIWVWQVEGILTAFADTKFYLWVKVPGFWLLAALPTSLWVIYGQNHLGYLWAPMLLAPLFLLPVFSVRILRILRKEISA